MRLHVGVGILTIFMASAVFAAPPSQDAAAQADPALLAATQSANTFSSSFFQKVSQQENGNLITSPFSADVVLAMASFGAAGETANQMKNALALTADEGLLKNGYKNLIEKLNNIKDIELSVANKIYIKENLPLKPQFKEITENFFKSTTESVNFSNAVAAADKINGWASAQTHDRIKEIVKADDLDALTALVLLNAVYFKGNWATEFNPKYTNDMPFHLDKDNSKQVPTMYRKGNIKYGVLPELKASFVELPYKGDELSMVIILPDEIEGLTEVENKLKDVSLNTILTKGYEQEVDLFLPKFTIESTLNLEKPLRELGMTSMFDNSANFSNIADAPLYVSKVVQKAFIKVNEEGSEAAAVTVVHVRTYSKTVNLNQPRVMKIDRPFYYSIVLRTTKRTPIFIGHVQDPIVA